MRPVYPPTRRYASERLAPWLIRPPADASCRKQKPARNAVLINPPEIAKLGDHLADLVDDDDLVLLIGADPDIVVPVDHDAVRGVDPGDEDRWRTGGKHSPTRRNRDLDYLMKRRV